MDMLLRLRRFLEYDAWANREAIAALKAAGAPPQGLKLMAHILGAQRHWLNRLTPDVKSIGVWPDLTLEACAAQAAELPGLWTRYLDDRTASDLSRLVAYTNTQGQEWKSEIEDVLMHVILHSVHHRGQIAAGLRAAGAKPAITDFIHAVRSGFIV